MGEPLVILVAEDDPVNLMLVSSILAPLKQTLVTCSSGEQALARLRAESYDLLIVDVLMPGLDGLALTRLCREDPRNQDIPILLLTALSGRQDLVAGFEAGATDYVRKPVYGPELLHRVKTQLAYRSLQRELAQARADLARLTVGGTP